MERLRNQLKITPLVSGRSEIHTQGSFLQGPCSELHDVERYLEVIHSTGSQRGLLEGGDGERGLKVFIRQTDREGDLQRHRDKNQQSLGNTGGFDGTEAESVSAR